MFRFAAPALMAGNTALLKHASNVPQCALAIEEIFHKAGFPEGVFQTLMISAAQAEKLIADPRIHAVTLTGSEAAGRKVAAAAGAALKKSVLELGGSDAFIVLADADLEQAVDGAIASRFLNCGQSCIAAKRLILVESIAEAFIEQFRHKVRALRLGNPMHEETRLGPMARADLRDQLHQQVADSVTAGASFALHGGPAAGPGFFYEPTVLDHVRPGMRAYEEELFGPVAVVIRAKDEEDAHSHRQRQPLRAGRDGIHARREKRRTPGAAHPVRFKLRQRHGQKRPAPALRRHQGLGLRSRTVGARYS